MGFCIGWSMIHNLVRRAPRRVADAAMMQPSGFRPEISDLFYQNYIRGWGEAANVALWGRVTFSESAKCPHADAPRLSSTRRRSHSSVNVQRGYPCAAAAARIAVA